MEVQGSQQVVGLGLLALFVSLVGIVGGAIANAKPKIAGILMLISGIVGFIAISAAYLIAGPLLIIGGIMAILESRKQSQPSPTT